MTRNEIAKLLRVDASDAEKVVQVLESENGIHCTTPAFARNSPLMRTAREHGLVVLKGGYWIKAGC